MKIPLEIFYFHDTVQTKNTSVFVFQILAEAEEAVQTAEKQCESAFTKLEER